jgi:hypothetical protein
MNAPAAAWRDASGGGALRAADNAGSRARLGITAIATIVAVMIGGSTSVLACPVCFGAEETSMIDGAKIGVLVMLTVTLAVQGGFVGFFLYLRKRAKRIADLELDSEWAELQRGPRTS